MYGKGKKFIGRMFDEISPSYDRLNHLFSGGQDIRWRKKAVKYLSQNGIPHNLILDIASGSGDLAGTFLELNPDRVYSVDLSAQMLKINKSKFSTDKNIVLQADAEHLPFTDNYFNIAGCAFGVRNFEYIENCIGEIHRVMKPGAKFLTIEMFRNDNGNFPLRMFGFYFRTVVPKIGNILSHSKYAYNYLFNSVDSFLSVNEYSSLLEKNGFEIECVHNNFLGVVHTVIAYKPGD
jgi:demethylmenaquinone methyltransferase/2-methoxy-6-polyprenyl-1,4-benzoquinol methylase